MAAGEATIEDFAALLDESFGRADVQEGAVVKGIVVAIEKDLAIIDIGLKTEGRVALREFAGPGRESAIQVGDEVEVYLERVENAMGEAVLSRDKARREESWVKLEKAFNAGEKVTGVIFNQVKGGFTVDLDGAVAFLPRSQVDIRPIRDVGPLMHNQQPFQILKMDRRRGNIVVSRRTVLEETRAEQRHELVQNLEEGQAIEGVVKNITDYGAFVDLGGIDGLLHVTDIAWRRVNHPTEVLNIGQTVKVKIIKINHETHRISLGMKQLLGDPWEGIEAKYPVEARFKGRVTNITDYGAFVELEPGIEGLIHVSEMSWTKKNVHPGKIVSTSQEVEVQVLEVDPAKRRISLGLKQTLQNPWEAFAEKYAPGAVVEGEVKNKTEFGLFLGLDGDVDGMVHLSDLDWNRPGEQVIDEFRKGDVIKAVVLDVDVEKERISLGIKQLAGDPFADAGEVKKGAIVTCEVTDVKDGGIEVKLAGTDLTAFIKRSELARDRNDQRPERFSVGEKMDARVTLFDRKARKVQVSVKALEIAEEKEAVAQYGSQDSGASLGDILGAAFAKRQLTAGYDHHPMLFRYASPDPPPALRAGTKPGSMNARADNTEDHIESTQEPHINLHQVQSIIDQYIGLDLDGKLESTIEELIMLGREGVESCLSGAIALLEDGRENDAMEYCTLIHKKLLSNDLDIFVGLPLIIQSHIMRHSGNFMSADLYAAEAAIAFADYGYISETTAALELISKSE